MSISIANGANIRGAARGLDERPKIEFTSSAQAPS
jgi:hypothetical protein